MLDTVIEYPTYSLRIHVLRPEAELTSQSRTTYGPTDFVDDFRDLGRQVRAAHADLPLAGADFGVARNLLTKYPKDQLLEYARIYWQRYYGDIRDDSRRSAMLHFAATIPYIRRDLGKSG